MIENIEGQITQSFNNTRRKSYDKNFIFMPQQGERTTECVGKSAAELGIVRQS